MDFVFPWIMANIFWIAAIGAAFFAAVSSFLNAAMWRRRLADVLGAAGNSARLGPFALSSGDANTRLLQKGLVEPERLWTYDAHYLARFVQRFDGGSSRALDVVYRSKILHQWDLAFAVALAIFACLVDLALSTTVRGIPVIWHALVVAAGMAIVYGAADVAEDLKLAAILKHPTTIDAGQTAAANALTRIKIVAITLSLTGGALFLVLSAIVRASESGSGTTPTATPGRELAT